MNLASLDSISKHFTSSLMPSHHALLRQEKGRERKGEDWIESM